MECGKKNIRLHRKNGSKVVSSTSSSFDTLGEYLNLLDFCSFLSLVS